MERRFLTGLTSPTPSRGPLRPGKTVTAKHPRGCPGFGSSERSKEIRLVARKVYFAVFGSGMGHATRSLEIARRLPPSEFEILFSSSEQGLTHFRATGEGNRTTASPPLDVEWTADGGFSSRSVLPRFPSMFNGFLRQLDFERGAIARFDPSVVVSDSKLSVVLAAWSKSKPVITMLNQFKVLFPPRFRNGSGRVFEDIAGEALGLMWSLSDRVLVTDLPPPFTIGEENLSGLSMARVIEFTGFTVPRVRVEEQGIQKAKSALGLDSRPLIYFPISGPDITKGAFSQIVLRASKELSKRYNTVISMGVAGGSTEPRKLAGGGWIYDWCPIKDELFELSHVTVARAGLSTIAQCIDRLKPAILVPIRNHPEQISNAEKFGRLGLGAVIKAERLTPQDLVDSIESCATDPSYRRRLEVVSAVSTRYHGVERCADIIRSMT